MKTLQAVGVGFGLAVGFAVACVAFVMCGAAAVARSTAPEAEPAAPAAPAAPTATAEATPTGETEAPGESAKFGFSRATFKGDQLDECVDMSFVPLPGQEAAVAKAIEHLRGQNAEAIGLSKLCGEQFAGRTVLATCVMSKDTQLGQMTVTGLYFSPHNVTADDSAMRDCISRGGDWQANPDEWAVRKVQRKELLQRAQEIAGELK